MSSFADAGLGGIALWAALILTGIVVGTVASRWNDTRPLDRRTDVLLLTAAAASVVAWFANAGSLLGSASASGLLLAYVPVATTAGFRVAVLWATAPGAALTIGVTMLLLAALGRTYAHVVRIRYVAALTIMALFTLGIAVWFTPSPNATTTRIPVFVQSAAAALAPLLALASFIILLECGASRVAGARVSQSRLLGAWVLATLAISAEQVARSQLGVGPRDAVILGGASSGLILWLVTSALLHRRVQTALFKTTTGRNAALRSPALAHAGAICLAVSFGAHAFASRHTLSIPSGSSTTIRDVFHRPWQLANQGVSRFDAEGVDVLSVAIEVTNPANARRLVTPEVRELHGMHGEHLDNVVSRRESTGNALQTIRVLIVEADSLDTARVRITFLPVPILWPLGVGSILLSIVPPLIAALRRNSSE